LTRVSKGKKLNL